MGVLLANIFISYPIFPAALSGDFSQHMTNALSLVRGQIPPFSALVLYYGVEFYLAFALLVAHGIPMQTVRLAMGLLVLISPLIIFFSVRTVFNSKVGIWSAWLYVLSGSLWFGMVFNSGLWPNFWGLLSALMLISAVVYFSERKIGFLSLGILLSALVNALFSHYSIVLVFPPLLLYFALNKNPVGLGILLAPVLAGIALFPSLISSIGSFAGSAAGAIPPPTPLAAFIPLPTLSFIVAEISVNFLGDFAAMSVLLLGLWFLLKNWKTRDTKMMLFSGWFLIALLYPVYSSNAWRFAFIGLMPLMVMGGWSLATVWPRFPIPRKSASAAYGKSVVCIGLLLIPTFGSWAGASFINVAQAPVNPSQQQYDYQTIQWMLANLPSACDHRNATKCGVIVVNDFDFQYLGYIDTRQYAPPLQGLQTIYAPLSHVVFTDPFQVQLFAAQFGVYILVAKDGTVPNGFCDVSKTYGLALTVNATVLAPNRTLDLRIDSVKGLNATVDVWDDGQQYGVGLKDGHAELTTSYPKAGDHTLYLGLGNTLTSAIVVHVVDGARSVFDSPTAIVPRDYCQPFQSYNVSSMRGWTVVYENSMVRLYKVNF